MAWLRTHNGTINTRYVHEVYASKASLSGEWTIVANMGYDPKGKRINIVLNIPELTFSIKNEIDARKALDRLMNIVNFEEEYEE